MIGAEAFLLQSATSAVNWRGHSPLSVYGVAKVVSAVHVRIIRLVVINARVVVVAAVHVSRVAILAFVLMHQFFYITYEKNSI